MDKRTALIRLRTLREMENSGMKVGGFIRAEIERILAALRSGSFPIAA